MKVADIRKKAKSLGVETGKLARKDLVRAIQAAEGNPQCFDSGRNDCPEMKCCWRKDCIQA